MNIKVEVCSKCHPYFTGKQKLVDTGDRVAVQQSSVWTSKNCERGLRKQIPFLFTFSFALAYTEGKKRRKKVIRLKHCNLSTIPKKGNTKSSPLKSGLKTTDMLEAPDAGEQSLSNLAVGG